MPDMSLAAQARRRLLAEGAPISPGNIRFAIQELEANPSLQEGTSSENAAIAAMGGHLGQPDTYKPTTPIGTSPADPGSQRLDNRSKEMSPLRPDSGSAKEHDRYFTADSQFGSDPTADKGKAKATIAKARQMADNDLRGGRSKANQGGTAGATPGSPYGSVSTESVASTEASIPPVKTTPLGGDVDYSNQLAKPKPTSMGAGQGPREQAAAREPPMLPVPNLPTGHRPTTGPPASPGVTSPDPALVAANQPAGMNPASASGVPPAAQVEPSPSWGDMYDTLTGWMPEGTGQRAQNVLGAGAAIGGPLLAAFMGMRGGRGGLTAQPNAGRPISAPVTTPPPGPIPGPPAFLQGQAPTAGLPPVMKPVSGAPVRPALPSPAVDDINVWGPRRMGDYDQVGQSLPPQTGVVPAGPAQSVPPPVITPAAPPPQLALPAPAANPVTAVMNQAAQAAPRVAQAAPKAATKSAGKGKGRAGTARLPPTPGKGMTLEDARASKGGGKPRPRARGNQ